VPTDFRTYNDPGVTIEAITPPVVFTSAIEPTILAIVGSAPTSRLVTESAVLLSASVARLVTFGADPETINVIDRLLGTQYVSGAIGSLDTGIADDDSSATVTTYDGVNLVGQFTILIDDEEILVTSGGAGTSQSWTITRAQNGTDAAAHGQYQVVNTAESYSDTPSLDVAVLAAPITSTSSVFNVVEATGVQVVTLTGLSGTDNFTLTYDGIATATITNGTNYTQAGIKAALEALAAITDVHVLKADGSDSEIADTGFIVEFFNPDTAVAVLSVTDVSGVTGVVSNRGVLVDTYIDVEGERMDVTAVSGSSPQTITVTRGFSGTTPKPHGSVHAFENSGVDYAVRIGAGVDTTYGTNDDTLSLSVLDTARISDGTAVSVTFSATDAAQFSPALFTDLAQIRDKYGASLTADGSAINSEVTLAAQLAFANGATQLILVATNPNDSHPIQDAIARLEFEQSVNVLAVLSGVADDVSYAKSHVDNMAEQGLLRRVYISLDGLSSPAPTSSDFISTAQQLHDERVTVVAPAQFKLDNGTQTPLVIPGYFAAVAVAGLQAGQAPQEPLTRKQVFGFVGINDQDTQANIFTMQSKGVLVVFQDRLGVLIVKHGLTSDMTSVYTREISVVTARDRLRDFIQETLDGGAIVGSAQTSETPNMVMAAVSSALEEARRQGLIFDYSDVQFRFPIPSNPTLIEVRFSYKPTLPLNYIHVQFSIDTSSGTIEFQSINQNPA